MIAPKRVDSHIISAHLFSESAHVTRRVNTQVEPGRVLLALEGLPSALEPAELRVSTNNGEVRAVETDEVPVEPENSDASQTPKDAIEQLRKKIHKLSGETEALVQELHLLDQVAPKQTAESGALRPDVFLSGLDVLIKRRREVVYALRVAQYELGVEQQKLNDAQSANALLGPTAQDIVRTSMIVVSLQAERAGDTTLDITYTSGWATWRPFYNLRLEAQTRMIEVARFADVWQETQEDWREIDLRLSTAEPERGLRLPRVDPWILESSKRYEDSAGSLYKEQKKRKAAKPKPSPSNKGKRGGKFDAPPGAPPPPMASRPPPRQLAEQPSSGWSDEEITGEYENPSDVMDAYAAQYEEEGDFAEVSAAIPMSSLAPPNADKTLAPDMGGGGGMPPPPPGGQGPSSGRGFGPSGHHPAWERLSERAPKDSCGGLDYEFVVAGKSTCHSGTEQHRLSLGARSYSAQIAYLLRPAMRDHAFGRITVTNEEAEPLLAGPASIFLDDAFFGKTKIETTPANGKLTLDLGAETMIKSARRTNTTVRTEGLISKEDIHIVEVTIEVDNFLAHTAELEIQDQVPISTDSKVKVALKKTLPKDGTLDSRTGIITFKTKLPPKGRFEATIVYEIEAPKDYRIVQNLKD